MRILVPSGGSATARLATELGLALAKATAGHLTILHSFAPSENREVLRGRSRRLGYAILADARRLGKLYDIDVRTATNSATTVGGAVRKAVGAGNYDLILLGTALRFGERKFVGPGTQALLRKIKTPTLLICQ